MSLKQSDVFSISRVTASGALDKLRAYHLSECLNLGKQTISDNKEKVRAIATKRAPASAKEIADAITSRIASMQLPYRLVSGSVCNVRQYDGSLRFEVKFLPENDPDAKKVVASCNAIKDARKANLVALDNWFEKGMYKIASREPVTEMFKVDPDILKKKRG